MSFGLVSKASKVCLVAMFAAAGPAFALPQALTENDSLDLARNAYHDLVNGNTAASIKKYDEAINSRLLPAEALANALLNRALARQHLGKHEEAIADYSAALNLDAMSGDLRATALYNRGLSQHKLGHLPVAIEDYTSALLLNSELPQAFLSRGQALRESGQLLFALSDFERALLFGHPNVGRINYLTGLTYEQLHRKFDARRHYEASLAADPKNGSAQQRLLTLGEIEVATTQMFAPGAASLAGSEIVRTEPGAAVEPTEELLAEAKVEMPAVETTVESPSAKISDRKMPEPEIQSAIAYTATEEASAEITSSITPAPSTLDAIPPVPEEPKTAASISGTEAVGPETPVIDSVIAATQPHDIMIPAGSQAPQPAPATGWTIQLLSASSEQGAWDSWKKLQKRNKALNDMQPIVVRADLGAKGIVYRVRLTGYEMQDAAKSACSKLKSKGVSCFVSRVSG